MAGAADGMGSGPSSFRPGAASGGSGPLMAGGADVALGCTDERAAAEGNMGLAGIGPPMLPLAKSKAGVYLTFVLTCSKLPMALP